MNFIGRLAIFTFSGFIMKMQEMNLTFMYRKEMKNVEKSSHVVTRIRYQNVSRDLIILVEELG